MQIPFHGLATVQPCLSEHCSNVISGVDVARHCSLQCRHNGCDSISDHQPYDWFLNRLIIRRSKKTPKLRVTGLCAGNSPVTGEFPAQMASNAENVSIWWRHHVEAKRCVRCHCPDATVLQWCHTHNHNDVIKWNHFPRYWPFVRGIHRSPVNSLHKGQWRGALMFSLICDRINGWVNNREAGDLRRHRGHYHVNVMITSCWNVSWTYGTYWEASGLFVFGWLLK